MEDSIVINSSDKDDLKYKLHECKNILSSRFNIINEINRRIESYGLAVSNAYGISIDNEEAGRLGVKIKSSGCSERNAVVEYLIKDDNVNDSFVMLRCVEAVLYNIINNANLTYDERKMIELMYFTNKKYSYTDAAAIYVSDISDDCVYYDKYSFRYRFERILTTKIIPVLSTMNYI